MKQNKILLKKEHDIFILLNVTELTKLFSIKILLLI